MNDILQATQALRDQAWATLKASPAFAQVRALDEAVVAMGGASALESILETCEMVVSRHLVRADLPNTPARKSYSSSARRISHAEAAYQAIMFAGRPMQSPELLKAARLQGADIGGAKPIINMTSSLSRSDQVYSLRIDGVPHWWIVGRPLPHNYAVQSRASASVHGQPSIFDERERGNDETAIDHDL